MNKQTRSCRVKAAKATKSRCSRDAPASKRHSSFQSKASESRQRLTTGPFLLLGRQGTASRNFVVRICRFDMNLQVTQL